MPDNYIEYTIQADLPWNNIMKLCHFKTWGQIANDHNLYLYNNQHLRDGKAIDLIRDPSDFQPGRKIFIREEKYNPILHNDTLVAENITYLELFLKMKEYNAKESFSFGDMMRCNPHITKSFNGFHGQYIPEKSIVFIPKTGKYKAASSKNFGEMNTDLNIERNYVEHMIQEHSIPSRIAKLCNASSWKALVKAHNLLFYSLPEEQRKGLYPLESANSYLEGDILLIPKSNYNPIIDNEIILTGHQSYQALLTEMQQRYPRLDLTMQDMLDCNPHIAKQYQSPTQMIGKNYGVYVPKTGKYNALSARHIGMPELSFKSLPELVITKTDQTYQDLILNTLKSKYSLTDILYLNPKLCKNYNGPQSKIGLSQHIHLTQSPKSGRHVFPNYKAGSFKIYKPRSLMDLAKQWGGSKDEWLNENKNNEFIFYDTNRNKAYEFHETIALNKKGEQAIFHPIQACFKRETEGFDQKHGLNIHYPLQYQGADVPQLSDFSISHDKHQQVPQLDFSVLYKDLPRLETIENLKLHPFSPKENSHFSTNQCEVFVDYLLPYIEGTLLTTKPNSNRAYQFSAAFQMNSSISFGHMQADIANNSYAQKAFTMLLELGYEHLKAGKTIPAYIDHKQLINSYRDIKSVRNIVNAGKSRRFYAFQQSIGENMLYFLGHLMKTDEGRQIIYRMDGSIRKEVFSIVNQHVQYGIQKDIFMSDGSGEANICPYILALMTAAVNQYGNLNGLNQFIDELAKNERKLTFQTFHEYNAQYRKYAVSEKWYENIALKVRDLTSVEFHKTINRKKEVEIYYVMRSGDSTGLFSSKIQKIFSRQPNFPYLEKTYGQSYKPMMKDVVALNKEKFGNGNAANIQAGASLKLPKEFERATLSSLNLVFK